MAISNQNINPKKIIHEIESNYDVKSITVNGLPVWQIIRNLLYSHELGPSLFVKKNYNQFINLNNWISLCKKKSFKYVLFTDSGEFEKINKKYCVDKVSQNLINSLKDELLVISDNKNKKISLLNCNYHMDSFYFHLKRRLLFYKKVPPIKNEAILKKIINHKFDYKYYLKIFFIYENIFNKWLDSISPKAVFVNCGYSLFHQALIYACNKKNVKTIELQHGLISGGHTQYSPLKNIGKDAFSQYLLTFSKWEKKFVNHYFINPDKVFPIGHYYLEYKAQNQSVSCQDLIKKLREKYDAIVLVSSQQIIEDDLAKTVAQIAKKRPQYCFIFKQRSSSGINFNAKNIVVDHKYSIYDFYGQIDLNLSCFSTSILESLHLGVHSTIVIDFKMLATLYWGPGAIYHPQIHLAKNLADLTRLLDCELQKNEGLPVKTVVKSPLNPLYLPKTSKEQLFNFLQSYIIE